MHEQHNSLHAQKQSFWRCVCQIQILSRLGVGKCKLKEAQTGKNPPALSVMCSGLVCGSGMKNSPPRLLGIFSVS